jgi:hypothetical protein
LSSCGEVVLQPLGPRLADVKPRTDRADRVRPPR